jgi:two-component system KDP operon response regulator KdpE
MTPAPLRSPPVLPKTVLVVEDESIPRYMACRALRAAGYLVLEAETGPEALRALLTLQPDLLVLDLGLDFLSGEELLERMRREERARHIPVVVASGAERLPEDVDAVLQKPFTPGALVSVVQRLLPQD